MARQMSQDRIDLIIALHKEGLSNKAISRKLGCNTHSINKYVLNGGHEQPPLPLRREGKHNKKVRKTYRCKSCGILLFINFCYACKCECRETKGHRANADNDLSVPSKMVNLPRYSGER